MAVLSCLLLALGLWLAAVSGQEDPNECPPLPSFDGNFIESRSIDLNDSYPFQDYASLDLVVRGDKPDLRILSLGASIMSGIGSPEQSGLRKWLRMALRFSGYQVNMVGTKQKGNDLVDNDHEAVPGAILASTGKPNDYTPVIREFLQGSLGYRPNIVIINGGTNNANHDIDVDRAGEHMEAILDDIWGAQHMSDTCVILSTLLPTTDPAGARNRISINAQFRNLVKKRADKKCIRLADMEPLGPGRDFLSVNGPFWSDAVHPNNEGHRRMAYVFFAAIMRALKDGSVKQPAPKSSEPDEGCDKKFANGIYAGGLTQVGSGWHDGTYEHESKEMGVIYEMESEWDRDQWRFARLFSPEYDDLLGWVEHGKDKETRFAVRKNSADGKGNFRKIQDMIPDLDCDTDGLHFLDMNADGLDDFVCIDKDGNAKLSVNQGDGGGDKPPSFKRVSPDAIIKKSEGKRSRVRLADVDGDGRGDYGIISDDFSVQFWRNGGTKDKPEYWSQCCVAQGQ